jgi:hypothetical protein
VAASAAMGRRPVAETVFYFPKSGFYVCVVKPACALLVPPECPGSDVSGRARRFLRATFPLVGHRLTQLTCAMMDDATLRQIAAAKATVKKGDHIWT